MWMAEVRGGAGKGKGMRTLCNRVSLSKGRSLSGSGTRQPLPYAILLRSKRTHLENDSSKNRSLIGGKLETSRRISGRSLI